MAPATDATLAHILPRFGEAVEKYIVIGRVSPRKLAGAKLSRSLFARLDVKEATFSDGSWERRRAARPGPPSNVGR